MINNITESTIHDVIRKGVDNLYKQGPINNRVLEELAFCKVYYSEIFGKYEQEVLYAMGMFYKTSENILLIRFI